MIKYYLTKVEIFKINFGIPVYWNRDIAIKLIDCANILAFINYGVNHYYSVAFYYPSYANFVCKLYLGIAVFTG